MGRLATVAAAAVLLLASGPARADGGGDFDVKAALAASRAAVGSVIPDVTLRDVEGRPVRLSSFRGRPLVISFVYTSCLRVCPVITQTLAEAAASARAVVGDDGFAIATIGFDSRADTPARMADFARAQGIDDPNWVFLSADAKTVETLAHALGFTFMRLAAGGFDHLAQTSILDADGRLYRQIYGDRFEAPALVEPLRELALDRPVAADSGALDGLIERVRLVCTFYDPVTGRYALDYSLFIGLAIGAASLGGVGFIIVRSWLRLRRQRLA